MYYAVVVTAIVIVYITSGLVSKMSDSFNNENEIDIPEDVLAAASEEEPGPATTDLP